jgi:DNA-binding transcriptional MerR regulator
VPGLDPIPIGEAARRLGISTAALRLYERRGLLPASARTAAGYRQFSSADLRRARLIRCARRAGLSLRQVAQLLAGPHDEARLLQVLRQHLAQLERESRRNAVLRRHLSRWLRGR